MAKYLLSCIIILLFSVSVLPQGGQSPTPKPSATDAKPATKGGEKAQKEDSFPPQAIYSDELSVSMPTFSKKTDVQGRGDILEVAFAINSLRDGKFDIYVFVIASQEQLKWITDSFGKKKIYPEGNVISEFVPFPGKNDNFEYDIDGKKLFKKYAKNYKLGVNPADVKPYALKDRINIRTEHLTLYRKNYKFFNNCTILIYDDEGTVLFRQIYEMKGYRTR
jgi:hypothetical protein